MVPAGNKAKRLSSVNHTAKQFMTYIIILIIIIIIIIIIITAEKIFKPSYIMHFYGKNSITIEAIKLIVAIKLIINSVICHLKHRAQPKLKVYFLENALKTITDEVKEGNFNYPNQIYYHLLTNLIIRSNINIESKY